MIHAATWIDAAQMEAAATQGGWERLHRALQFSDYNTRVVLLGVVALGIAAGILGATLVLRRRVLTVETFGHATLPGVCIAFVAAAAMGATRAPSWAIWTGAVVTGFASQVLVDLLSKSPRVRPDSALAVSLAVFFGVGAALLGVVQQLEGVAPAGLGAYLYGRASALVAEDAIMLGTLAVVVCVGACLGINTLRQFCFDPVHFQISRGARGVRIIERTLLVAFMLVATVGLQAIGLVLVMALFVAPACAARCLTERFGLMLVWSGAFGALGALTGALLSAVIPRVPTGPAIVLTLLSIFVICRVFGRHGRRPVQEAHA